MICFLRWKFHAFGIKGAAASRRSGVIIRTRSAHRCNRKQGEGDQQQGNFFEQAAVPARRDSERVRKDKLGVTTGRIRTSKALG
jgi:hypothetical protein